jgi:filamentous hemagglutinin family protein
MNHKTLLKLTPIAASLVVAMSSYAHAAAPAANTLPGAFLTNNAGVTYNIDTNTGTIANLSSNAVLQFGGASSLAVSNAVAPSIASTATAATAAGFNIGASAALNLNASATGSNVLISDLTGQASNIYGSLTANANVGSLFIANPNGVVVGGSGNITATNVGLIGYQADAANFATTGVVTVGVVGAVPPSITGGGSAGTTTATNGGAVTVSNGASVNVNAGYLLVAGAGQVNVGAFGVAPAATYVAAGSSVNASTTVALGTVVVSSSAVANLGVGTPSLAITSLGAAGAVNVLGNVQLNNAAIAGTLTNNANVTLTKSNVNSFTNNANAIVDAVSTFGNVTNSANLTGTTLNFGGAFVNSGKASLASLLGTGTTATATVSNAGMIVNNAPNAPLAANNLASFTNTGSIVTPNLGITAGTVNLGGTVANTTTSAMTNVSVNATTGDLIGSASLNANSVSLQASSTKAGNVNYTGAIAGPLVFVSAVAGAVSLGAVNMTTSGSTLQAAAGNGNVVLNGDVVAGSANLDAAKGSVLINKNITVADNVVASAQNQIMVYGNVSTATTGSVSLYTANKWSGAYNLGVVVMPSGSVSTGTFVATVDNSTSSGNMLQYGNISAASGFNFTGNSYYQGAGAAINTSTATFDYGNASSGGAIAGGIVFGSANPQPSNAFFNAVVVGGSNASTGVTLAVNPANLGTAMQNVNLMGIGNTTLAAGLPTGLASLFGSTGSTVINTGFVPSNLFIRAQGGNLTLSPNSNSDFYWPGLVYASTVQAGKVATVDTTKVISVGTTTTPVAMSNALPYQAMGGAGIYLMTGKVNNVGGITVNTNSNVSVLNPLQVAGVNLYTASAPTGLVLNYNATLPAANVVSYTPPAN